MTSVKIGDLLVDFPYEKPYDIQKVYMDKVITCLKEKKHGLLESPTGTGKTLCLFAPVAAWSRQQKELRRINQNFDSGVPKEEESKYFNNDVPMSKEQAENLQMLGQWGNKKNSRVWYTARTHSQIAQTVAEVRRCNIKDLHIRVLGARDQLCINEFVLQEKDSYVKTAKCKELVKARKCRFYNKLEYDKVAPAVYKHGEVLDIEDLVSAGRTCGVCPYFLAKKATDSADIVLLPYNYIIDKDSREGNSISLYNDVVIFDEGHNIPNKCEESFEFNLTSSDVVLGIKNIQELMDSIYQISQSNNYDEELNLKKHAENSKLLMETFKNLDKQLNDMEANKELQRISFLHRFFEMCGINDTTSSQITNAIEEFKADSIKLALSAGVLGTFYMLEQIINVIFGDTVKSFDSATVEKSFKFCVLPEGEGKKICLYCFNPSFGIRSLLQLGVQSLIITSGTLSPLKTCAYELDIPWPVTLENGHIAKKNQVPFVIVSTGVNNERMDGSYKNRTEKKFIYSLGMTLTNLISSIPDGVLLLFSSYAIMQTLKEDWDKSGVWSRLKSLKRVFLEPRGKDDFISCMENFKRAIDSGNGAILMGVLRGKISEGMDFKDQYCRGVFIIGVPFPPVQDPRVKGKERYAESLTYMNPQNKKVEKLYNNSFMAVEAMKATNQAIGRVIRHGQDYGAIVLVDYRFAWPRLFNHLSAWLRGNAPIERNFSEAKKILREFFKSIFENKLGVPEVRCQAVDANGVPRSSLNPYETYDHSKVKMTKPPARTYQVEDTSSVIIVEKRQNQPIVTKEHISPADLLGCYTNPIVLDSADLSSAKKRKNKIQYVDESSSSQDTFTSLFDALGAVGDSGVGYREDQVLEASSETSDSNKRKCLELTPRNGSLFSLGKKSQNKRLHLSSKIINSITSDPSLTFSDITSSPVKTISNEQNNLKQKIQQYVQQIKKSVSEKDFSEFSKASFSYMKNEAQFKDIIPILRRVFSSYPTYTELFKGFEVCVRSKDKGVWAEELK